MGVVLPSLDKRNRGECGLRGSFDGTGDLGGGRLGEADLRDGGSNPSGSLFQCWMIPQTLGVRGQYVFLPHLGSWGGNVNVERVSSPPKQHSRT